MIPDWGCRSETRTTHAAFWQAYLPADELE